MQDKKLYAVIGCRTAADAAANRDEVIARGLPLEEARRRAIAAQKSEGPDRWIAAWVEADSPARIFDNKENHD